MEFSAMPKMARFSREIVITEKIDGTNASIWISEDGLEIKFGSRTRWITPQNDNAGFAKWAEANKEDLLRLGPGHHFGEWWGGGIQRGYGFKKGEKFFSLFNTTRWNSADRPDCCLVVPELYRGLMSEIEILNVLYDLKDYGSSAAPGYMNPEGIVIYHTAANICLKKTIKDDESPKSLIS